MNKKLIYITFRNTFFATVYIFLVSTIMQNGDRLFGNNNIIAPFAMLLLFSLSAAVVGGLVFGKSVALFFDHKIKDGLMAAVYSVCWLGLYTFICLSLLAIIR